MTHFIGESIFWTAIAVMAIAVYQAAILPGARLSLRYRVFALRDRLRSLVISGRIEETDKAFQLLHGTLNALSSSLHRYDFARLFRVMGSMDSEQRERIAAAERIMDAAPADIKKIYEESVHVLALTFVCNSLLSVIVASLCLGAATLFTVGFLRFRDAFVKKVDEDTKVAFFTPELCAI